MNLQEIKDRFEQKTKGGHALEILAYREGQHSCLIGTVLVYNNWVPNSWTITGNTTSHEYGSPLSLVVKKEPLPKDILCEVWSKGREGSRYVRYTDGAGEFFTVGEIATLLLGLLQTGIILK